MATHSPWIVSDTLRPTDARQAPRLGAGGMHCPALKHGSAALAPRPLILCPPSPVQHALRSSHGPLILCPPSPVQYALRSSHGPVRGSRRAARRLAPRAGPRDVGTESAPNASEAAGSSTPQGYVEELDSALAAFAAARSAQQSREQESARRPGGTGASEPVAELEAGRKALELARSLADAGHLKGFGKGAQVSLETGSYPVFVRQGLIPRPPLCSWIF